MKKKSLTDMCFYLHKIPGCKKDYSKSGTPPSTIFQLSRGGQFYWWRKPEYQEKTTDHIFLDAWILDSYSSGITKIEIKSQ
jgi:hypothetical protein